MIEVTRDTHLGIDKIGGKALQLIPLMRLGFNIPKTFVIGIDDKFNEDDVVKHLSFLKTANDKWPLAVRSSAFDEDGVSSSKAGHYKSILGVFDKREIFEAVQEVKASGPKMAVIVQPLLDGQYSGVGFSCDPLTFERSSNTISWSSGLAEGLVSGVEDGTTIITDKAGNLTQSSWPTDHNVLEQLSTALLAIEDAFDSPVDVEWVIDSNGKLWIVQARPVVLPESGQIALSDYDSFGKLPNLVHSHPKIRLRRNASAHNILMSPATIEWWSRKPQDSKSAHEFGNASGASVVLLHPERIDCKVLREFAPIKGSDVEFFTKGCRRYAIRRYPKTDGIVSARNSILKSGLDSSWVSVGIVQLVWDALATGIIRQSDDGYVLEVAQGHFVPKGVVPTSIILLDSQFNITQENWTEQPTCYQFIDGHVVTVTPPDTQLKLTHDVLIKIAKCFSPLFDIYSDAALEFGLLENGDEIDPYLIDIAEGDVGALSLDNNLINSGVISVGKCVGKPYHAPQSPIGALDGHLHDRPENVQFKNDVIVCAERASVDLLPYVGAPGVRGFIFKKGSILAHLSVVIRENNIPAIITTEELFDRIVDSKNVIEIDAENPKLTLAERVRGE